MLSQVVTASSEATQAALVRFGAGVAAEAADVRSLMAENPGDVLVLHEDASRWPDPRGEGIENGPAVAAHVVADARGEQASTHVALGASDHVVRISNVCWAHVGGLFCVSPRAAQTFVVTKLLQDLHVDNVNALADMDLAVSTWQQHVTTRAEQLEPSKLLLVVISSVEFLGDFVLQLVVLHPRVSFVLTTADHAVYRSLKRRFPCRGVKLQNMAKAQTINDVTNILAKRLNRVIPAGVAQALFPAFKVLNFLERAGSTQCACRRNVSEESSLASLFPI